MTNLVTIDGSVLVKDGKVAEDCKCCGEWYCYKVCCPSDPCTPVTLAFWKIGPPPLSQCINLRPYKFVDPSFCSRPWRFVERGETCNGWQNDGVLTWFDWGIVGDDGRLNGQFEWSMDTDFCSDYPYPGYLYLEIGCTNSDGSDPPYDDLWPTCNQ